MLKKFEIDASHTKTYRHYVSAKSLDEAKRIVMDNEHDAADLIEEGEKTIERAAEVSVFDYEKSSGENK